MTVYELRPTSDDDRPQIDFQHPRASATPESVSNLETCATLPSPPPARLFGSGPSTTSWDFFAVPGTLGLFSQRAVELLSPHANGCFGFVPATLDGAPYAFVVRTGTLDALDHARSELTFFRSNPERVKRVVRHAFRRASLDGVGMFAIPEDLASIYATEGVVRTAELAGLRGLNFDIVEP
jgi:hypothetical protein